MLLVFSDTFCLQSELDNFSNLSFSNFSAFAVLAVISAILIHLKRLAILKHFVLHPLMIMAIISWSIRVYIIEFSSSIGSDSRVIIMVGTFSFNRRWFGCSYFYFFLCFYKIDYCRASFSFSLFTCLIIVTQSFAFFTVAAPFAFSFYIQVKHAHTQLEQVPQQVKSETYYANFDPICSFIPNFATCILPVISH